MVLVIDNYDSFVYNLVQYLGELGAEVRVFRNDALTIEEVEALSPTHLLISPGPCTPNESGISLRLVEHFYKRLPILGVCLGHQVIGQVFGGKVVRAAYPVHGKTSLIYHDKQGFLKDVPSPLTATRYHSLIVEKDSLPSCLEVSAWLEDGVVMGLRHREYPVEGVQFHPESILTPQGKTILKNFLRFGEERRGVKAVG